MTRWRVVVRKTHVIRTFRATFNGERARVRKTFTRNKRVMYVIRIDMRGLPRGVYVARIRYTFRGDRLPVPRRRVHYYRACGGKDSLNARSIIVI